MTRPFHSPIRLSALATLALTSGSQAAALTLRLWKKGARYDPTQLTQPAH